MKTFIAMDIHWVSIGEAKIGLLNTKYVIRAETEREAVEKLRILVLRSDDHVSAVNNYLQPAMVQVDTRWGRVTYELLESDLIE